MPQQPTDPQLLSKVLRTKLGLGWEPRWDTPQQIPEAQTADDSVYHPNATAHPIPSTNMGTMMGARDLANPAVRQQLGLPPLMM